MSKNENEHRVRETVLEAFEVSLDAQIRAVRRLRKGGDIKEKGRRRMGMSQVDLVHDILRKAGVPLHVTEILRRVEADHGVRLDRESVVSALSKKVARGVRFVRTDRNTFAVRKEAVR
jgi:hypothetical protein